MAELGYIVIWAAFLSLYKLGHIRWGQWDRVERYDAFQEPGHRPVTRSPALVSSVGFVVGSFAIVAYVFAWPMPVIVGLIAVASIMILAAIAASAIWWHRGNPIAAPPVDAAGV